MTERRLIPSFPDYGIDRTGTVWRMTPAAPNVEARHGPSPRPLSVVWVGNGKWFGSREKPKRYAAVTMTYPREPGRPSRSTKRTVWKLMDELWPEVGWKEPNWMGGQTLSEFGDLEAAIRKRQNP